MNIVIRAQGSETLKFFNFETEDEAKALILKYVNESEVVPLFYRVDITGGDNTIILKRIRVAPGSEVTDTVVVGADIEDNI